MVVAVSFAVAGFSQAAPLLPVDPVKSWADTYLINELLVREANLSEKIRSNTPSTLSPTEKYDSQFLLSRAVFAQIAAKESDQAISQILPPSLQRKIGTAKSKHLLSSKNLLHLPLPPNSESWGKLWSHFQQEYGTSRPECPIRDVVLSELSKFQSKLEESGQPSFPDSYSWLLAKSSTAELRCLAMRTMSVSGRSGAPGREVLNLLAFLAQLPAERIGQDTAQIFRILYSVRLVQLEGYADALAILLDLQETSPPYRLAYDMVQRLYSQEQRGKGIVALKNP